MEEQRWSASQEMLKLSSVTPVQPSKAQSCRCHSTVPLVETDKDTEIVACWEQKSFWPSLWFCNLEELIPWL